MSEIKEIIERIKEFRDARDWKQFHKPKDLALSLTLEAAEVAEHFQWKSEAEIQEYVKKNRNEIGDELADVFYWVLLMCSDLDINIVEAFNRKMTENEEKYPAAKAKGRHTKYNKL
jgi:dCTP diphosphatase